MAPATRADGREENERDQPEATEVEWTNFWLRAAPGTATVITSLTSCSHEFFHALDGVRWGA